MGGKQLQHRDERQSREFAFARWIVNRTGLVFAISLSVPLICTAIVVFTRSFEFSEQSDSEYLVRGHAVVQETLKLGEALDDLGGNDASSAERGNKVDRWDVTLYLRALSGNAITAEMLTRQYEIEQAVLSFKDYEKFCFFDEARTNCDGEIPKCAPQETMLRDPNLFGVVNSETEKFCGFSDKTSVSDEDVNRALSTWFPPQFNGSVSPTIAFYLGNDITQSNPQTAYVRSVFTMGAPLAGFTNSTDRDDDQNKLYVDWAKGLRTTIQAIGDNIGDDFEVLVFSYSLYSASFGDLAFQDFIWIAGSASFVLVYMCIHTGSIYLGLFGIIQILLAYPFTYFFYRLIFQVKLFTNLHLLSVFIILGIGADDVFVFTDAWVQAGVVLGEDADLVKRLSWTYRRASKAVLITSFTTATAFFVTATNALIPISAFGIWAGCLIIFQYLLCLTLFPCNILVWHRNFRFRRWSKCLKKVDPITGEVVGSNKATAAQTDLSQTQVESGVDASQLGPKLPTKLCWILPLSTKEDPYAAKEDDDGNDFGGSRQLEIFYHRNWSPLLAKLRYPILALTVIIFGVSIYGATQLAPLTTEEAWIPDSNPVQKPLVWSRDFFGSGTEGGDVLVVQVLHGVVGLDQSEVAVWDPSDVGEVVWDDTFDLTKAATQQIYSEQCERIRSNSDLVLDRDATCWINDFSEYLRIVKDGVSFFDFASQEALYNELLLFLNYTDPVTGTKPYQVNTYYVGTSTEEKRLKLTIMDFTTPNKATLGYEAMYPIRDSWADLMIAENAAITDPGINKGSAASSPWTFMVTTAELVSSAIRGFGISLAVAFLAMVISTLNIIVSFYAIVTVAAIVTCVMSLMHLYGWNWGISESVAVVLIVGFAVDYVVHLANAYIESGNFGRYRRSRDAITEMGISIVAGAITSFGSGVFLIGGQIIFFDKFGIVMMTTIGLSLLWSTIAFLTIIITIGPNGNFGSFLPLFNKCGLCLHHAHLGNNDSMAKVDPKDTADSSASGEASTPADPQTEIAADTPSEYVS